MKNLLIVLLFPIAAFATEDSVYEWEKIQFETYVSDISSSAKLEVFLKEDPDFQYKLVTEIKLFIDSREIEISPKKYMPNRKCIIPTSFRVRGSFNQRDKNEYFLGIEYQHCTDGGTAFYIPIKVSNTDENS